MLAAFVNSRIVEPTEWIPRHTGRPVFYKIDAVEDVETHGGPMVKVNLTTTRDLSDPNIDIAALVAGCLVYRSSGKVDPQAPELWYWRDKFWTKALASDNTVYYRNHQYLLYEVQVQNADGLLGSLSHD